MATAHVIPNDDLKEHEASADCWCGPTSDEGVLVHHAADHREEQEREGSETGKTWKVAMEVRS